MAILHESRSQQNAPNPLLLIYPCYSLAAIQLQLGPYTNLGVPFPVLLVNTELYIAMLCYNPMIDYWLNFCLKIIC